SLKDAIQEFCSTPLPPRDFDPPILNWDRTSQCIASLQQRLHEAEEVERISRLTLPLLEELRQHVGNHEHVNRIIGRIDKLRTEMNVHGQTYDLIVQLTQTTELKRFQADRKIVAARLSGDDLQRGQTDRDIANVKGIAAAAAEFQTLMRSVIASMEMMVQTKA